MNGLTKAQLAEKAGVSRASITRFESGKRTPRWSVLVKLAGALKCHPSDLWDVNTPERPDLPEPEKEGA